MYGTVLFLILSAQQGRLGPTSTGQVRITITVAPKIVISEFQDFKISSSQLLSSSEIVQSQELCVSSNMRTKGYVLQISSANENNLINNNGDRVQYQITTHHLPASQSPNCNGERNAKVEIKIPAVSTLPAGTYQDLITLTAFPE